MQIVEKSLVWNGVFDEFNNALPNCRFEVLESGSLRIKFPQGPLASAYIEIASGEKFNFTEEIHLLE